MSDVTTPTSVGILAKRVSTALAAYEIGKALYNTAHSKYVEATTYTLTVQEGDAVYPDVHRWLLDLSGESDRRNLTVVTSRSNSDEYCEPSEDRPNKDPLVLQFNDRRSRTVRVDGHLVKVQVKRLSDDEAVGSKRQGEFVLMEKGVVFTCRSAAALDAVIGHVRRLHAARTARRPRLKVVNQWGHWSSRDDLPGRSIESVILPEGQMERLVGDLGDFLGAEDDYNRLALPWHRGYLLHGPPGTGKTSLVKALANHFNLDLWYCSLSDLSKEASLINLLSEVSPRSIVLLEDVDTVQITHRREDDPDAKGDSKSISLSSLLNALDGVATPHGLITFMTTNHVDRLDSALTRAGRMDVVEELGYPTWREVNRLFHRFYGPIGGWVDLDGPCPLTQAEVSEALKTNMHDPERAAARLNELVSTTGVTGR